MKVKAPIGIGLIFLMIVISALVLGKPLNKDMDVKSQLKQKLNLRVKKPTSFELRGPRYGAENVPNEYGFWSFAMVTDGKLSRSGQPNETDFRYLKNAGYKTIISLRFPNEYDEETSDKVLAGFASDNFKFVSIPIQDGGAPTLEQANQFLNLVKNEPGLIHLHCRGGYGRTGTLIALYRFEVDEWPMDKAIEESRLFEGGVDEVQRDWLLTWAKANAKS